MTSYLQRAAQPAHQIPVTQPLPGRPDMVADSDGAYVFAVDVWTRLRRWLILGSEGGSYYAGERELTAANIDVVHQALSEDAKRAVDLIADVSSAGVAPKNDPAVYALAIASMTDGAREHAYRRFGDVIRIGTHLFMFASFREALGGGWGPGLCRAIGRWYLERPADSVAYQAVKYRDRHGFTHNDVLRLAHPDPAGSPEHATVFEWITLPPDGSRRPTSGELPRIIEGFLAAQRAGTPAEAAKAVREYRLPWEALKTDHTGSPDVNMALLETGMPMGALVRQLARLTRGGVLEQGSDGERIVLDQLSNGEAIRNARLHPVAILIALKTYALGRSLRGSGTWVANPRIVDALDEAFYLAFDGIEPTGKRRLLAVDVSPSMGGAWSGHVAGVPGFTAWEAAAALAMVSVRSGDPTTTVAFAGGMDVIPLSAKQRLDDVLRLFRAASRKWGMTDISLPFKWADAHAKPFDVFEVYTDNETNSGTHPSAAMQHYRRGLVSDARLIVAGLVANGFTVADPRDPLMLDVVGLDASAPAVMRDFITGNV